MKVFGYLLLCVLLSGCAKTAASRDADYVRALQERRAVNDLDRQILVAKCGEVINLWQASIIADANAGREVSGFAERLVKSKHWPEFRDKRRTLDGMMRQIMDPPERYKAQYEKVLRQYGYTTRLLALLEKPTGSLVSYTAEVRLLAAEYDQLKAELDVSLPVVDLNSILAPPK